MTNTVIHLSQPMRKRGFHLMIARAKQLKEDGENVILTHCAASGGTCAANLTGNHLICVACRHSTQSTVANTGMQLVPLIPPSADSDKAALTLSFREKARIVTGIHSCLVTALRVLTKDLNRVPVLRAIKRRYFRTASGVLRSMHLAVSAHHAERIEVLNGRMACSKIGLIAAARRGIPFHTLDFNGDGQPMLFEGSTPHDRIARQNRILRCDVNCEVAKQFFDSRKNRRFNKFAAKHKHFSPPLLGADVQRTVSFFLSSQDECESLGPSWRSRFRDNAAVIRRACEAYPDYFFCVRFHPNQAGIISDITSEYRGVESLPNLQIYYPHDDIDTYGLIQWSDVVVTFGTTVAVEACWSGKPVIQLGPSFSDRLQISHIPKTTEEFIDLLATSVRPCPVEGAARYADHLLNDFDHLRYLDCESGRIRPIGFHRKWSIAAKLSKEFNNWATVVLKKVSRRQLWRFPKAA